MFSNWFDTLPRILIAALLALAGSQLATRCTDATSAGADAAHARELATVAARWADTTSYYKERAGRIVAWHQAAHVESAAELAAAVGARDSLQQLLRTFAHVDAVATVRTVVVLPPTTLRYDTPVTCKFVRHVALRDSLRTVVACVDEEGLTLDTVALASRLSLVIGRKSAGLLRPPTYRVEAVSSNPNVHVLGLDAVVLTPRPPWWQRRGVAMLAGAVAAGAFIRAAH